MASALIYDSVDTLNPDSLYSFPAFSAYDALMPVFEEVKTQLFPTFKYLQGNCHAMAHFAALVLEAHQVEHKKIWYFAPCKYQVRSKTPIILPDKSGLSPTGLIRWGYHVSNVVLFEGKQWVFDFGLNEHRPMLLSEWVTIFRLPAFHVEYQAWQRYLFYTKEVRTAAQRHQSIFNGHYFDYEGLCKSQYWLPKGLAINETAYHFWENDWQEIMNETLRDEYKKWVGSITNFECVLRDHAFNPKMTPAFQAKHRPLIEKYRAIYQSYLIKWQQKVAYWQA